MSKSINATIRSMLDEGIFKTIFSQELLLNIQHYFGDSEIPNLYDAEVLLVKHGSAEQKGHADISITGIENPNLKSVRLIRLAAVCIISTDGAGTTRVFPNTRSDATFEDGRDSVRATESNNCVLFDGRLGHYGIENTSGSDTYRLILVFIHPKASREQIQMMPPPPLPPCPPRPLSRPFESDPTPPSAEAARRRGRSAERIRREAAGPDAAPRSRS
jgi:hypothetical protein